MTTIVPATTDRHFAQSRHLFEAYAAALGVDLCFQRFEEELQALHTIYDNKPVGCGALRPLDEAACEMKRLYVTPAFREQRLGRRLAEQIMAEAHRLGYRTMRLDTLASLKPALTLYASLGFRAVAPYYANPLPDVVYMERDLTNL
ncbi:MAG: GNAT family N-acetyltransferase [Rhodothermales bacterium]